MLDFEKIRKQGIKGLSADATTIRTIDMHTGGEPLRVILDGYPELEGNSVLDYRNFLKNHHDHLRKALMWEPRGHADMYGCILTPPNDDEGDFGIVFLHNEGYSTMCGHAIIAISKLVFQMGWKEVKEGENELKIDAPCGRIQSFTTVRDGQVRGVKFIGVPSFVVDLDASVNVPGLGKVIYDLAYGGAFYAYVDMEKNNFDFALKPSDYQKIIKYGMDIKRSVIHHNLNIHHPFEVDLSFLYGTIFLKTDLTEMKSNNVCIFADGEVDRCPTGSGVMGRMAIHYRRNEITLNQKMAISGIVHSTFKGEVIGTSQYGEYEAVIPQVEGNAFITGQHTFIIDPDDPLKGGFILR
jgi:trans-L-3-hydroxyproline dehydratase